MSRTFVLPFKPEELLAQPSDERLWAEDLPSVDDWTDREMGKALDGLIGRLLSSRGMDLADCPSFSLIFACIQAWPRLGDGVGARVAELLVDAARRIGSEVSKARKMPVTKPKEQAKQSDAARGLRTVAKVSVFFLQWVLERLLRDAPSDGALIRRGRGGGRGGRSAGRGNANTVQNQQDWEETREMQRALERRRCSVFGELANMVKKEDMAWLWMGDPAAFQQVAHAISAGGFLVLDNAEVLKHRESRQLALQCITEPLLQEGQQHSNLLVATVSKLIYGLRGGEGGSTFAADTLVRAHTTALPRLLLVELPQHCTAAEIPSQGTFQRSLAGFLVALAERLPHVVLANISLLLPLLDVDCYPIRSSIVESIGQLLTAEGRKLPSGASSRGDGRMNASEEASSEQLVASPGSAEERDEEAKATKKKCKGSREDADRTCFVLAAATKKDLLETLMTRTLDKSVWVRYRALQTLNSLASNRHLAALPRDQWARVLQIATRRMQDTASMTRKASMQLVRVLIEFHPYGPALEGSGDERMKAEQVIREVVVRLDKLNMEEADELEKACEAPASEVLVGEGDVEDCYLEDGGAAKRRRIAKKTVSQMTVKCEVDKFLLEAEDGSDPAEERERQRESLKRMQQCYTQRVQFVELIDAAEARLRGLLSSRTTTDVTEAMGVVVALRLRGVVAASSAFDQILGLVWSRQGSIKDAAVDAFHRIHLEGCDTSTAARGLLEMYQQGCDGGTWTHTHLASVQELIQQSAEKEFIDPKEMVTELVAALDGPQCQMALRALIALAAASVSELDVILPRIAKVLGPAGIGGTCTHISVDKLIRTRLLCQLLQRFHSCLKKQPSEAVWECFWVLCNYAIQTVVESFVQAQVPPQWFGAAQTAIDLSFDLAMSASSQSHSLHRCPDKLWELLLRQMLCSVLGGGASIHSLQPAPGQVQTDASPATVGAVVLASSGSRTCSSPQLGAVVFIAGHIALRMLAFLEGLQSNLKRKRLSEEDARMAEQREKGRENAKKKGKKSKSGKEADGEAEDEAGAEASSMGMAGQEERENEAFADVAEHGLLYGPKNLLDRLKPLILACLLDPQLRQDPILRRLGAISLCKYMTVSKRFCEESLQLLFSILFPNEKHIVTPLSHGTETLPDDAGPGDCPASGSLFEDLTLRQSLLVAVGDLLFRHPNVVEPWTGRLYAALGGTATEGIETSSAAEMRLTALLVLTHLVLNDMMKPRAVLLVRVLWLTACAHEPTSRVARILFQELSKRTTYVVYNLLPEIIARLPEHRGIDCHITGGAEDRVQYIMQFVDKEKHIEGLIEKLSIRLEQCANVAGGAIPVSTEPIADENLESVGDTVDASPLTNARETVNCLAHALGSMNYTDRCILRLQDVVVVRKALNTAISYHPVVRECLLNVVEKARKPKGGKEKGADGAAPMEDAAANGSAEGAAPKGGASAAAASALDAIEKAIEGLAAGQEEADETAAPVGDVEASTGRGGKAGRGGRKRADRAAGENQGIEEETEKAMGRKEGGQGRGRGRGHARGRGATMESGRSANKDETLRCVERKRGRAARASADDDDYD